MLTSEIFAQSCLDNCETTPILVSPSSANCPDDIPDITIWRCCDNIFPGFSNIICVRNNESYTLSFEGAFPLDSPYTDQFNLDEDECQCFESHSAQNTSIYIEFGPLGAPEECNIRIPTNCT